MSDTARVRIAAGVVLCGLVLAGCSSGGDDAATPAATSSAASSLPEVPSYSSSPTAVDAVQPCASLIGQPFAPIYQGEDAGPRCLTGTSAADDATGFSVTPCVPTNPASKKVVSWGSTTTSAPDQNYYAAYVDGPITVVPGASPAQRPIVAAILQAVGSSGCA